MTEIADNQLGEPQGRMEHWREVLRRRRNEWAHGASGDSDLLKLLWSTARAERINLGWRELSTAFQVLGLPEFDRPEHVGALARQIAESLGATRVLDPYSEAPVFLAQIAAASSVREAVGVLPPEWHSRDLQRETASKKLRWIEGSPDETFTGRPSGELLGGSVFDFVVSSPPLMIPLPQTLPFDLPGPYYRRNLAYWVLAESSRFLSKDGILAFQLADNVFLSREGRDLLAWLADNGVYRRAAISLSGGLGSGTRIPTSLVVFDRTSRSDLFVAQFGSGHDPTVVVDNLLGHRPAKTPENGLLVASESFRGWGALQVEIEMERQLRVSPADIRTLGEVAETIQTIRLRPGEFHEAVPNAVYVNALGSRVQVDPPDVPTKTKSVYRVYEVVLNRETVLAEFVAWWLSTDVGQLARKSLDAGIYLPQLRLADVGMIRIVVPTLEAQHRALLLDARLRALKDEVTAIELELGGRPHSADQLGDRLDSFWEDPLEAWVNRLPYPLAAIIDRYIADAGVEAQVERLLHFFEAFAEFGVAVLLGVIHRDEQLWADHREDLAEPGPNGKHAIVDGTFGGWTSLGFKLAKALRSHLQGASEAQAIRRDLFAVQDERFAADLTSRRLWNTLDKARQMRNALSHREYSGRVAKKRLLATLKDLLAELQEATAGCFTRAVLIQPGASEFDGELHIFPAARRLLGPNSNLRERPLETLVQLKSRGLYFADPGDRITAALEVVPLLQLMPAPESEETTVYFAGARGKDGYKLISYQTAESVARIEPAPQLDRLLEEFVGANAL
jgi:hypothetical protein